jgi:hypothetical protein
MKLALAGSSLVFASAIWSLATLALNNGPEWACILVGMSLVFSFWVWLAIVLISIYRREAARRSP